MMNFNNFDDLVEALKENVSTYAKCFQEDINKTDEEFYIPDTKSTQIEEVMRRELTEVLDSDFNNVFNCFKTNLTIFFNENFKTLGKDLSAYIVFKDSIQSHADIMYQYTYLQMPFGYKDKDKYDRKIKTWLKKYNTGKITSLIEPSLSPYELMKFLT